MFIPYKSQLRYWWNTTQFPATTHRSVSPASTWTPGQHRLAWAALIAASCAVLLPNLSYPLIEPDETRYAQIAFEMNQSRDWITPTLDGVPYLDKPPLMYWLTATSFNLLGNNGFAARLPSVLSALATILLIFWLGSKIVGQRAAWFGSLSLVLCGGFALAGRFLILDALLAMLTTLCLLSGYIAVRGRRHRWAWWMLSGIACAMGVLTKGPLALVLCAPPLVASGWLRADQTRTRAWHWAAFVVPMFMVCVPWYIAIGKFNPQFVDYFFWEHNVKRFTEGSNHQQPFWFYLPILFVGMFPASLLLPSVGVFLVSRSNHKRVLRSKDLGFLFCASAWMLLFFSLASCKLPTYILPAIPLICLMLGVMLDQTVFRPDLPSRITTFLKPFPQRATMILVVSCLGVAIADVWIGGQVAATTIVAILTCLIFTIITIRFWNREVAFAPNGWAFTAIAAVGMLSFASVQLLPTISMARSVHVKTKTLANENPGALVIYFGEKSHGVQLQLPDIRVVYFSTDAKDDFVNFLSRHQDVILVTGDERIEQTRAAVSATHDLVASAYHEHLYMAHPIEHPTPQATRQATRNDDGDRR